MIRLLLGVALSLVAAPAAACDPNPNYVAPTTDVLTVAPGLVLGVVFGRESAFVMGARATALDYGSFTRGVWAQALWTSVAQHSEGSFDVSGGLSIGTARAIARSVCSPPIYARAGGLFDLGFGVRGGTERHDTTGGPLAAAAAYYAAYLRVGILLPFLEPGDAGRSHGFQTYVLLGVDVPIIVAEIQR